ncbi:hypothetical protein BBJ28_00009151 [Nothophytophthora sp. Chile5]|nr:hypothetical protein BBJ28_00009151 [Nothophytophthora sp. Chile5]
MGPPAPSIAQQFIMSQEQEEADAPEIVSEFPAPPKFFTLYLDGVESGPPPPDPMEPTYHMFGSPYSTQDIIPDLLPQEGKKLYLPTATAADHGEGSVTNVDSKAQMKKYGRCIERQEAGETLYGSLDDVELLFLNMHNLINAFRPHQARETVIQMLKTQIQERRDAARDIRRTIDESRRAVELVHGELHESTDDAAASGAAASLTVDEDVKMEDVNGAGAAGAGGQSSVLGAAGALVLTPAQKEQAEVGSPRCHSLSILVL